MLTMSTFGANGRAGNQLFQWAFISSLSRKLSVPYILPKWEHSDKFKGKFETGLVKGRVIKERGYGFHDYTDLNPLEDLDFFGHFQNEKYFDDQVKKEIDFTEEYKAEVKAKFSKYFARPTISIGVRRTDYLTLPYYQLGADYYISALEKHFPDWRNYNLVFISDDLDWCRGHFGCIDGAYFPQTKDIEQMCLSSLCDHFIIANSTFHWWGAFIGEKEYSKIVQPTKLFIGSLLEKHGDSNFYSERWISHEAESIDLTDVTFTIPVYHDSNDRKENLELTVSLLQRHFKTNIIIGEQGSDGLNIGCEYVKFDLPNFHRTKMLNDMAKMSKTPFIANWDCDVFVPPMQILQSVWFLRNGAKMIYPYDDKFCRIMRKYRKMIFPWYDIGAFFSGDYNRDTPSFGGAVMWNKQTYFEIGGENEYFISFGPEDVERMERALALGIKIERVRGRLYHFNHWCGPDSSVSNPFFKTNRELLEKQRKMSVAELKDYINSWPWHSPYTESYYETIVEDAIRSRDAVFEILGIDRNESIADAGGGCGQWGVGLKNYTCIDYRVPLDKLMIDPEQYIDHDLRIPLNLGKKFDVVLCLEVAEHIEEAYADTVVENVCNLVKDDGLIIFSAAIPYQGGNNHCNEQWQTYWAKKFQDLGYCGNSMNRADDIRAWDIRANKNISLWYRQNIVIYRKIPGTHWVSDYVLPEYFIEIVKHLKG